MIARCSVEDAPLTARDVAKDPHIDKRYVNQTPEEIAAYKKDTDATLAIPLGFGIC